MLKITIMLAAALLLSIPALAEDSAKADKPEKAKEEMKDTKMADSTEMTKEPEMKTTASGVRYQDLVMGKGHPAKMGSSIECHYTIWTADSTGLVKVKKIQSSKDSGKTFGFTMGPGLIQGWVDGMVGMEEGGTRMLYVPWELGYGERGNARAGIAGKSNLIFEIDYVEAK